MCGVFEEMCRVFEEMGAPPGEDIELIGDGGHVAIEVIGEKDRFPGAVFEQELFYFFDLDRHQMGKWFVEEGEAGIGTDDDIQFDKPAMAAGELAYRFAMGLAEFGELLFEVAEVELEVVEHSSEGQGSWDKIELGEETDQAGIMVWPGDGPAIEGNGMSGCREGPVKDLQQTGFAGAIAAEKTGYGPCPDPEVDVAEDGAVAEGEQDGIGGEVVHGDGMSSDQ
jgi:hypothetical protein